MSAPTPPAPGSTRSTPKMLPPVWFLLSLLAMAVLNFAAPGPRWVAWPWTLVGIAPLALGLALTVSGSRWFGRHGTAVRPFEEASALVTDGPFRFSRNPMYLGMVTCLAGVALCLGTATPWIPIPLFWALLHVQFVLREEPWMAERFGAEYAAYCSRVRRWL